MSKISTKVVRTLLIVSAMVMMMCMPASASTSSVKAVKVGKTSTIKNTSKVTSTKPSVASAKKKNSKAWKVTALKKGKSTLKVYDKNGKLSQKIYLISYNNKTFKYNTDTLNLNKGESKTVTASTNISGITIKYKSTNSNVASVDANGKITAKNAGSATIKAVYYYKGVKLTAVKKPVNVYTSSYNTDSITMTVGNTKTVSASISSNCTAKYSSSDTSVATVSTSGKITAKKKGTATITCKIYLGSTNVKTYTKKVTVNSASSSSSSSSASSSTKTSSSSSSGSSSSSKSSSSSNSGSSSSSSGSSSSSSGSSSSGSGSSSSSSGSSEGGFVYHASPTNISIAGGKKSTAEAYCEKAYDVVTFKFSNDCVEFTGIDEGTCRDDYNGGVTAYYTSIGFVGRKEGQCSLYIYVNGDLLKTVSITVTSTDDIYYTYLDWKQAMKDEIWTSGMTDREKIDAVSCYIRSNYVYLYGQSGYMGWPIYGGGDCYAQADLIIDIAHDLGLEAEEYMTSSGHVYAIVYFEPGVGTKVDISLAP